MRKVSILLKLPGHVTLQYCMPIGTPVCNLTITKCHSRWQIFILWILHFYEHVLCRDLTHSQIREKKQFLFEKSSQLTEISSHSSTQIWKISWYRRQSKNMKGTKLKSVHKDILATEHSWMTLKLVLGFFQHLESFMIKPFSHTGVDLLPQTYINLVCKKWLQDYKIAISSSLPFLDVWS